MQLQMRLEDGGQVEYLAGGAKDGMVRHEVLLFGRYDSISLTQQNICVFVKKFCLETFVSSIYLLVFSEFSFLDLQIMPDKYLT